MICCHEQVPVHRHREEMAAILGGARHLPRHRGPLLPEGQEAVRPRHVPLPVGCRTPCRPPGGLHRHRHILALLQDARLQRASSDGIRLLRPSRRELRHQDRHAPQGDHQEEHRELHPPDKEPWHVLRLGPRDQHLRGGLLPLDAVDLPPALQEGSRLRGAHPDQLVSLLQDGTCQRGGQGRHVRALRHPRRAQEHQAVDAEDNRLRRRASQGSGRTRLARIGQADAAQLDRQERRRRGLLRPGGHGREARGIHHPLRHALRRHLHGHSPGAPPCGQADHERSEGRRGGVRQAGQPQERPRQDRPCKGEDRRLLRQLRHQPGQRQEDPHLDRGLRPDQLRHRRNHGRARPRHEGLGVRQEVRPSDRRGPERGCGRADPGLDGGRHPRQLRLPGRSGQLIPRGAQVRPQGRQLQAARLGLLPPALLG